MIWFRQRELERKLTAGEISEKAGFQYLLAYIIIILIIIYLPEFGGFSNEWYYVAEGFLILILLGLTFKTALALNYKSGNRDFLKRALSLSFVIGLRLAILFTLLHLLYKIIMFIIPIDLFVFFNNLTTGDLPNLLFTLMIFLSFYFLLIRSFKRINLKATVSGVTAKTENQI